jgi:transcriptional regulator with XRE-family HTH domain
MDTPGQRLRMIREAQGLSLGGLSRRTGLDPAYISRVENDHQRPSVAYLRKVGEVLPLRELMKQLDLFVGA